MPIRIKPSHDLGPCILTLDSIKNIAALVERDFTEVNYSASDKVWEIYDEPVRTFLDAISKRETLDSFRLQATSDRKSLSLRLVFNEEEATVTCEAPPEEGNWFEHFLIDLNKFILSPYYRQLIVHKFGRREIYFRLPLLFIPFDINVASSTPYSRIIIRQKPPNPFIENIKANLVSNIIWLVAGGILVFILQWILRTYGIDLNPFN